MPRDARREGRQVWAGTKPGPVHYKGRGSEDTACGIWVVGGSFQWRLVTCKKCLRTRARMDRFKKAPVEV